VNEQRGVFIGTCGCLVPVDASGRVTDHCACERRSAGARRRDYLAQLRAAVEDVIELADEVTAATITDVELRTRLAALADRARDASTGPHRSPARPPGAGLLTGATLNRRPGRFPMVWGY